MKNLRFRLPVYVASAVVLMGANVAMAGPWWQRYETKYLDDKYNFTVVGLEKFTKTDGVDASGNPNFKYEVGRLDKDGQYVTDHQCETSGAGTYTDCYYGDQRGVDAATLNAISGKPVMTLDQWVYQNDAFTYYINYPDSLEYFSRSTGTYSINGHAYVTVSAKAAPPATDTGTPTSGGSTSDGNTTGGSGSGSTTGDSSRDDSSKPTVNVSSSDDRVYEGRDDDGRFLVSVDSPKNHDVKVVYTVNGKARNGKDYERVRKYVWIPAGNVSTYVQVTPTDDNRREGSETVKIRIRKSGQYDLGSDRSATIEIVDND